MDVQDMWEGEQWEIVGKGMALLIPVLLLGGAIVGGFAANTYNQGAEYDPNLLCSNCPHLYALTNPWFPVLQLLSSQPFTR